MLTRAHGCIRALAWNADFPPEADLSTLPTRLAEVGFTVARVVGGFTSLRDGEGNEIALVLATHRVQLRVSYLVPEIERRHAAERLYTHVLRALDLRPPAFSRSRLDSTSPAEASRDEDRSS
jgi:hypothetical protein